MGKQKPKDWWKQHYDNWISSELSIGKYCSNNNIKKSSFYRWIKIFRATPKSDDNIKWATIAAIESRQPKEISYLKLNIGKANIQIPSNFDSNLLDSVVQVLVKYV